MTIVTPEKSTPTLVACPVDGSIVYKPLVLAP